MARKGKKKSQWAGQLPWARGAPRMTARIRVLVDSVMEKLSLGRGRLGTAGWPSRGSGQRTLTCQMKANFGWDSSWVLGGIRSLVQSVLTEHEHVRGPVLCTGARW